MGMNYFFQSPQGLPDIKQQVLRGTLAPSLWAFRTTPAPAAATTTAAQAVEGKRGEWIAEAIPVVCAVL